MAKLWFVKGPGGNLTPADDACSETMRRYKTGAVILGDFKEPRNGKHHRKCFALLQLMFDNQEKYKDFDPFYEVTKLKAGCFDLYQDQGGHSYPRTWSFSYNEMDQIKFEKAYQMLVTLAIQDGELYEGKTHEEAENFVNQILGGFA